MNKEELVERIFAYAKQKNLQFENFSEFEKFEQILKKKATEIGEKFDQLAEKKQDWLQDFKYLFEGLFSVLSSDQLSSQIEDTKAYVWPVGTVPECALIDQFEVHAQEAPLLTITNIENNKNVPSRIEQMSPEHWIFKLEKSLPIGEYEVCVTGTQGSKKFEILIGDEAPDEASIEDLMQELRFLEALQESEFCGPEEEMFKKAAFTYMSGT